MELTELAGKFLDVLANITDIKEKLNITPTMMLVGAAIILLIVCGILFLNDLKKGFGIALIGISATITIALAFMGKIAPVWALLILAIIFVIVFRDYIGLAIKILIAGLVCILLLSAILVSVFSEPLHESLEGGLQAYEKYQTAEQAYDYVSDAVDNLQEDPIGTGSALVKDGWNKIKDWI